MDPLQNPSQKKNFSFPNSDQAIPGVSGDFIPKESTLYPEPKKKTISIYDAIQQSKNTGEAKTIKTFQSDLADAVKNDNVSMIKVALAEKKRQEQRGELPKTETGSRKYIYIFAGLVLFIVVIGLTAGAFVLFTPKQTVETVDVPQFKPLLYTKLTSQLNINQFNPYDTIKLIDSEREAIIDLGEMKAIVFTTGTSTSERPLTTEEFFSFINSRAPDQLVRSLDSNFLLGIYAYTPRETFAVFKVNSYDSAFAGMLQWEPNIESDIGDIFINKKDRVDRDVTSTSTIQVNVSTTTQDEGSSQYGIFSQRKFVDRVYNNKDVRVLVDSNGKEALLYSFIDKETLVIATTDKSLKEILFNLTTGRIIR